MSWIGLSLGFAPRRSHSPTQQIWSVRQFLKPTALQLRFANSFRPMGEFRMPSLGADMEAAVLFEWRVKPGDQVKRGDIIAEVTTDKGDIEVEVFEDGVVERLVAQPGSKLPVGAVLAVIRAGSQAKSHFASPETVPSQSASPSTASSPGPTIPIVPASTTATKRDSSRPHVSPLARKIAAQLGVDLSRVTGTGPGGAIERVDVERAAATNPRAPEIKPPTESPPPKAPPPIAGRPFTGSGMRRAIASAMARANREIPHYYLQTRIDMSASRSWLAEINATRPIKTRLLPAVLLLKAVATALKATPDLNGYWKNDQLERRDQVHVGVAIASRQGGLITPAIHDVQSKSLDEIMEALNDLIPRTRLGRLRSSELSEGTITVTNLGDLGVETVFGVIYPPQVALVGFGRVMEQPWASAGMLGVRPVLTATLAADHRATDGRTGARFLDALDCLLQKPDSL